jgi:hypothetical protein
LAKVFKKDHKSLNASILLASCEKEIVFAAAGKLFPLSTTLW